MSLDDNGRSDYQARELKSVFIEAKGNFVRLVLHKCFVNNYNLFSQVGLVAVNVLGDVSQGNTTAATTSTSSVAPLPAGGRSSTAMNDLCFDLNFDPITANRIRELSAAKDDAVARERYDVAKQLKAAEDGLRAMGVQLARLDLAKQNAVEHEDYDVAKGIKSEIETIRMRIEEQLSTFEGFTREHRDRMQQRRELQQRNQQPLPGGGSMAFDEQPVGPASPVRPQHQDTYRNRSPQRQRLLQQQHGQQQPQEGMGSPVKSPAGHSHAMTRQVFDQQQQQQPHQVDYSAMPIEERPLPTQLKKLQGGDAADAFGQPNQQEEEHPTDDGLERPAPEGPNPLEGLEGYEDLPVPELIRPAVEAEAGPVVGVFGDYLARCFFSKTWSLREAALRAIVRDLDKLVADKTMTSVLPPTATILRISAQDKVAHVCITSLSLLEKVLNAAQRNNVTQAEAWPQLQAMTSQLVRRLADSQARVRDSVGTSLLTLAWSPIIGTQHVAAASLRMTKPISGVKAIVARLGVLHSLVNEFSIGGTTGLTVDNVLGMTQRLKAFEHSSFEVRDAAKSLVVAVHKRSGDEVVTFLQSANLGKRQLKEYMTAIEDASDN